VREGAESLLSHLREEARERAMTEKELLNQKYAAIQEEAARGHGMNLRSLVRLAEDALALKGMKPERTRAERRQDASWRVRKELE